MTFMFQQAAISDLSLLSDATPLCRDYLSNE